MIKPKVSVVMPMYNARKYIRKTIESILNQTFQDFELLIINDASTDSSLKIICLFQDSRIRIVENDKNLGVVATRNKGLKKAQGEYIAVMDADDIMMPERLEKQVNILENHPEFGAVSSTAKIIDENDTPIGHWSVHDSPEFIPIILLFRNFFIHSSLMFRASLPELFYRPDFQLAEDYDLMCRIVKKHLIYTFSESLVQYRSHTKNLIHSQKIDAFVYKILTQQLSDLELFPSEKELQIHQAIGNFQPLISKSFVQEAEDWLLKLHQANQRYKIYKTEPFKAYLQKIWFTVCIENTKFTTFIIRKIFKSALYLSPKQKIHLLLVSVKHFLIKK